MGVIQERTAAVLVAKQEAKDHCMCARFEETPHYYIAYYPVGYFPDGVRVSKGMGCANALKRMVEIMERHFQESF